MKEPIAFGLYRNRVGSWLFWSKGCSDFQTVAKMLQVLCPCPMFENGYKGMLDGGMWGRIRNRHRIAVPINTKVQAVPGVLMNRFPSKTNSLHFLKSLGVEIGTVLDVGTHEQTPELRLAFPDKRHILFEPASEFYPAIAKHYEGLNYELVKAAVSNSDGVGRLKKTAIDGGDVSHSTLVWGDAASDTDVQTIRLDTFLSGRNEPKPYLLKIDVDGFEIPILEGTEGAWGEIDCVIIEATQVTFLERLQFVISRGYRLFDIVDQCYYSGVFSQADLVFVAERVFQRNAALRPWETQEFAWSKWIPVASFESNINPE